MARSSSGKSVARAAATGGGATYRGQMPVNWYAALVAIVLVGLGSVALAKFHYNQTAPVVEPTTTTTWHAGLAVDICGTMEEALAASPTSSTQGLTTTGQGLIVIAPKSASEAGHNATLGKFASEYTGFTLTNTSLQYPGKPTVYKNGDKCPSGTPDAGKVADVKARSWILTTKTDKNGQQEQTETGGATTLKPASLKFENRQLITLGFAPPGTQLPKPPSSTILALVQAASGSQPTTSTTTSVPLTPTTPASSSSSTTAPSTTSTTAASTTTTKPTTATSTTKPPSTTTTTK